MTEPHAELIALLNDALFALEEANELIPPGMYFDQDILDRIRAALERERGQPDGGTYEEMPW